jgi:hypothetical protein
LVKRNAGLLDVLERKAMSQTINNVAEAYVFLSQPFRERLRAQPQCFRHSLPVGFAMMQQLVQFIFD